MDLLNALLKQFVEVGLQMAGQLVSPVLLAAPAGDTACGELLCVMSVHFPYLFDILSVFPSNPVMGFYWFGSWYIHCKNKQYTELLTSHFLALWTCLPHVYAVTYGPIVILILVQSLPWFCLGKIFVSAA